jgi:hypothetical protein
MIVILTFAGLVALVAVSVAPFCLPWHHRLRWLIAASTVPDPWGLGTMPWQGLEELTVQTVTGFHGGLLVAGVCGPAAAPRLLWLDCTTTEDKDHLEWSAATKLPLLLIGGTDGALTLYGPTWSVSGLQTVAEEGEADRPDRLADARHQQTNAPGGQ